MRMIGIHGKAGAGKDTIASYLQHRYGMYPIALADPIKRAAAARYAEALGIPMLEFIRKYFEDRSVKEVIIPELGVSPRQIAQWDGTEGGRDIYGKDCWIKLLDMRIQRRLEDEEFMLKTSCTGFTVTDVRFDNEADYVHSKGGIVIEVIRGAAASVNAHKSESGLSAGKVDHIICNNGTLDELFEAVNIVFNLGVKK